MRGHKPELRGNGESIGAALEPNYCTCDWWPTKWNGRLEVQGIPSYTRHWMAERDRRHKDINKRKESVAGQVHKHKSRGPKLKFLGWTQEIYDNLPLCRPLEK